MKPGGMLAPKTMLRLVSFNPSLASLCVRTQKDAREGLNKINLNDVFGTGLPPGFIGIFENQDPTDLHTYVVVRSNVDNDNLWYAYQLAGPLA